MVRESLGAKRPDPVERYTDLNAGWAVFGTLLSGLLVWGGIGWLLAWATGLTALIPVGILVGMAAALYLVYVKYGRSA